MPDTQQESIASSTGRGRGRPRSRYADRGEQVRVNMRLYRARQQMERQALERAMEQLLHAVEAGDVQQAFAAGAAVAGIWKDSPRRQQLKATHQDISQEQRVP